MRGGVCSASDCFPRRSLLYLRWDAQFVLGCGGTDFDRNVLGEVEGGGLFAKSSVLSSKGRLRSRLTQIHGSMRCARSTIWAKIAASIDVKELEILIYPLLPGTTDSPSRLLRQTERLRRPR